MDIRDPWIAFDEIHKRNQWRDILKGAYDIFGEEFRFLITGSARLDLFRKAGDSLSPVDPIYADPILTLTGRSIIPIFHSSNIPIGAKPLSSVFLKIDQIVSSDSTVIILGETGTGEDLVARAGEN